MIRDMRGSAAKYPLNAGSLLERSQRKRRLALPHATNGSSNETPVRATSATFTSDKGEAVHYSGRS